MTPQELKNNIIHLAIRGKLVEQLLEDGSAEDLYQAIQSEKQLKGIKDKKKMEPITGDIIPFCLPDNWRWVRFGDIVEYNMGKTPPRAEALWWKPEFPWVSIADMPESGRVTKTKESVSFEAINEKFGGRVSLSGTMIMSFKLTIGRVSILDIDAVHNEAIISIYPFYDEESTIQSYLFKILPTLTQFGDTKNAIKGKTLNHTSICNLLIPLPPLAEQRRIVAKIEKLMPHIDSYEQVWSKLEDINKRFPTDMEKSILQLAIQGKLVQQRPEEGTAEELYQRIRNEKKRLIKEGSIKRDKPLPEIAEDEIPFDIPKSWFWVRLGAALVIARGGSPRPIKAFLTDSDDGINWIKIGDTERGKKYIDSTQEKIIPEGMKKSRFVQKGDFLLSNSMSFGRPYILNIDGCVHDGWLVLRQIAKLFDKDYLFYLLSSPMVFHQFCRHVAGAVVNNLNSEKVALTIVAVPPLAEQKRIVARIEELLPLCEKLRR